MKAKIRRVSGRVERVPFGEEPREVELELGVEERLLDFRFRNPIGGRGRKTQDWPWTATIVRES